MIEKSFQLIEPEEVVSFVNLTPGHSIVTQFVLLMFVALIKSLEEMENVNDAVPAQLLILPKGYVLAPYHNAMKERYCHLIEQDALYAKHLPELNKETQDVQLMHVTLTKLSPPMVNAVLAQVIPDLIHN